MTPPTGNVLLGKTLQLDATVTGTENTAVVWSVNGVPGGNSSLGVMAPNGLYTAPASLPSTASVQVTAASTASQSAHGSAQVTIISDISVALSSPATSVEPGAKQNFSDTVSSAGNLTARSAGFSSAPPALRSAAVSTPAATTPLHRFCLLRTVTLTAQSAADPSKQASVNISITSHFILQLAAPGTVATSTTAVIVATMTPVAGSNPSSTLNCSLSGTGCSGSFCGTLSSVTTPNPGCSKR